MTLLGKAAAIATIIAATFTIIEFYSSPPLSEVVDSSSYVNEAEEASVNEARNRTLPGDNDLFRHELSENNITENEIKVRFGAAIKIPGSSTRGEALKELAERSANFGYFDTAIEIAENIPGSSIRSLTLSNIAKLISKTGNIELAIKAAKRIPGSSTRNSTLHEISKI